MGCLCSRSIKPPYEPEIGGAEEDSCPTFDAIPTEEDQGVDTNETAKADHSGKEEPKRNPEGQPTQSISQSSSWELAIISVPSDLDPVGPICSTSVKGAVSAFSLVSSANRSWLEKPPGRYSFIDKDAGRDSAVSVHKSSGTSLDSLMRRVHSSDEIQRSEHRRWSIEFERSLELFVRQQHSRNTSISPLTNGHGGLPGPTNHTNLARFLNDRRSSTQKGLGAITGEIGIRRHNVRGLSDLRESSRKSAAIIIQKNFRGYQVRRLSHQRDTAAIKIQTNFRGFQARRMSDRRHTAATTIQNNYRGYQTRRLLDRRDTAAIKIQRNVRGYQTRRLSEKREVAAVKIQKNIRGHQARRMSDRRKSAAMTIQKNVRGYRARRLEEHRKSAAVVIQKSVRGHQARRRLNQREVAARKIQKNVRQYQKRVRFISVSHSTASRRRKRAFLTRLLLCS